MRFGACLLCCVVAATAQSEPTLIERVRTRAAANLAAQPNYTCHETIERSTRSPGITSFKLRDTIQLEVALIKGRELFSRSGAARFEDAKITDIITTGTRGNGDFALYTRMIFLGSGPEFHYRGESIWGGRRSFVFDYNVSRRESGWQMHVDQDYGYVGYRGEFHVDADTLDLQELTLETTEVPDYLKIRGVGDRLEYQRIVIGTREYLLPRSSDLVVTASNGIEDRNRTLFHGCREYAGESVLSFDEAPDSKTTVQ